MMGDIYVVNYKKFDRGDAVGICENIMRPSDLGNPFKMDDEGQREIVVRQFYHYLRKEYQKKGKVYEKLMYLSKKVMEGEDLYLICCCSPKLCHGDIIKNALIGIINNEIKKN